MIKGGKGGARTRLGLVFEAKTNLSAAIEKLNGYSVANGKIFFKNRWIASILRKGQLYDLLGELGVPWRSIISAKMLPDEIIFSKNKKKITIIEKKSQTAAGSVDEKLQTCDFKKKQYEKLFKPIGIHVEYIYVFNKYFKHARYKDVLEYINSVGCHYIFWGERIPLDKLGLPKPLKQ